MEYDPIIQEIRDIRAKLMEQAGGDLRKLAEIAQRTVEELGIKTVDPREARRARDEKAVGRASVGKATSA